MERSFFVTSAITIATIASVAVFAWTLVHAIYIAPDTAPTVAPKNAPIVVATTSDPVRIIIPTLHVNAKVQYVGVTAKGAMGTPNNFTDVAWYKYGVVPGQIGSAVIDGHVDNGLALDGVFKHLEDIKIGDDVYIGQKNGLQLHFVVVAVESYPYNDVPTALVFNAVDTARLNLITCGGAWVGVRKTYDHRIVVFTKLAER